MKYRQDTINQVYDYILSFSNENGFPPSVREICAKFSIKSTASVYQIINKLEKSGLLVKSPLKKRSISITSNKQFAQIPLVGTITAGTPIFAVQNLEGYIPLPIELSNKDDYFALKVKGDSMVNANIYDKDIIFVKKQETAKNGDIIVALVDDSATVKRFFKRNKKIILHPENDQMNDIILSDVNILGIVKGLIRKF